MKRNRKRLLAGILALCLSFALFPERGIEASDDPNVKWYKVEDGEWMGFNTLTQTITWYPKSGKDVTIPEELDGIKVLRIGEYAFSRHDSLKSVTLPETVEVIDTGAFQYCDNLVTIKGFTNVKTIGEYAFYNSSRLESIDAINNVRSVGMDAFVGCSSLGSLIVPASVSSGPLESSNIFRNIYSDALTSGSDRYFTQKVTSYLYWDGKNYYRVENPGVLTIEKYTKDFELIESFNLETDLKKLWGGFFCGKKYNFIITGDYNEKDSNSKTVITIDKYSKDWKKLKTLNIKGFNTHHPFGSGALRCAESGNYLYIHTSSKRYTAADGFNHQGNLMIEINENTMKKTDGVGTFTGQKAGGVSHSFNQFILIDSSKNIITLNHGDAGPRSIALFKNAIKAGKKTFSSYKGKMISVYNIPKYTGKESYGYNYTGTSIGGLEETKSGYITSYASDKKGGNLPTSSVKNVYLTYTPKSNFTKAATKTKKVTSYSAGGKKSAGTPQMVATGKNSGYIIWDIIEKGKASGKVGYVKYNASGGISKVKTAKGSLSDCKPIYANGKVIWYVTNGSAPVIYTLTGSGVKSTAI